MAQPDNKNRVAAYLRVSTTDQATEGQSLPAQLDQCLQYVRLRGWPVPVCVYVDAGISGASVAKRPAMTQLLADIEAGRVQTLVVSKLDRAWRSVKDAADSLERIQKAGAALAILDLQVDTSTSSGEMMLNLLASFAQFERKRIGERTLEGTRRIAAQGRWQGARPPLGYSYNKETQQLEINEGEAETVREIYRLAAEQGYGAQRIAKEMNARGLFPRSGVLWYKQAIRIVLHNPVYVGEVIFGRGARVAARNWWRSTEDNPKWVRAPGQHPAIIDRETWVRVQEASRARQAGRPNSPRFLYAGLLRCGECGSVMYSSVTGTGAVWGCSRIVRQGRGACSGSWISNSVLEHLVTPALKANLNRFLSRRMKDEAALERTRRTTTRDRDWWERYRLRNQDLYRAGAIEREEWEKHEAEARRQLDALDRAEVDPLPTIPPEFARRLADRLDEPDEVLPVEEKKRLIALFVERIVVSREAVEVHYRSAFSPLWRTTEQFARSRRGFRRGTV